MKIIFSILSLFFILSTNFIYARTLSKKEYRYLVGTYLLGKGNKKRLLKLLSKTEIINTKLLELENKQKSLEKNIETLKLRINELSNKLDQIIKLLKATSRSNISKKSEINQKAQKLKDNLQIQKVSGKDEKVSSKNEKGNLENKIGSSENLKIKNTKETSVTSSKYNFEKNKNNKEKQYTISDLINDIENAIYYKGKGNIKSYEKLIKKMKEKYPEYSSKLDKCLKNPDYIFQLYIEVLNLESK